MHEDFIMPSRGIAIFIHPRKKMRNTLRRLRPEEFSSGDFGLRSFRQPEISAWAEISDISARKLRIFQRGAGRGWEVLFS